MQNYVGITPPNDRDGCMQDIHWMDGAFGYFPTYTLGAMTAAQLFETVKGQIPDVHDQIMWCYEEAGATYHSPPLLSHYEKKEQRF